MKRLCKQRGSVTLGPVDVLVIVGVFSCYLGFVLGVAFDALFWDFVMSLLSALRT